MKKILLILTLSFLSIFCFAQSKFEISKVDSISKTKSELYSATKMFISEYWKSAQDVIQNDDKESGLILIKGSSIKYSSFLLNQHRFIFSYTVKFLMKDNKYKVEITNVYNTSHTCVGNSWGTVDPCDNFTGNKYLPAKKGNEMFLDLYNDLQGIVNDYNKYLQSSKNSNDF